MNQAQALARAAWLERQAEASSCNAARASLQGWAADLRKVATQLHSFAGARPLPEDPFFVEGDTGEAILSHGMVSDRKAPPADDPRLTVGSVKRA